MLNTAFRLHELRSRLATVERPAISRPPLSLCTVIDRHLPEQGLSRGALHEIQAGDPGAGLALCAVLLARTSGDVVWIVPRPDAVWAPGLQALGLDISRLILAHYHRPQDGLWSMEEALRCQAIGGVVLRLDQLNLTASRRLQLAAEAGGGFGLLLRSATAGLGPSSAATRWQAASLPHRAAWPQWQIDRPGALAGCCWIRWTASAAPAPARCGRCASPPPSWRCATAWS